MSFLSSIHCFMGNSEIRNALETIYASITVGHKLTRKLRARAIYVDFLTPSEILPIFEEFWRKKTLILKERYISMILKNSRQKRMMYLF